MFKSFHLAEICTLTSALYSFDGIDTYLIVTWTAGDWGGFGDQGEHALRRRDRMCRHSTQHQHSDLLEMSWPSRSPWPR